MTHRWKTPLLAALSALVLGATLASAHDLFLRPRDFIVVPGRALDVRVLNGTFTTSEAAVAVDRLRDLAVVGPRGAVHPDRSTWTSGERESRWRVVVDGPGTHALGASLHPRTIRLSGSSFTGYLREEALDEVIEARRVARESADSVHERYAKHVKALVRARGSSRATAGADTAYRAVLGYPAELVPLDDPYVVRAGGVMRVRALVEGAPARNQPVLVGGRTPSGARHAQRRLRTDSSGMVRVRLDRRGTWYVKFIDMRRIPAAAADSVDYESRWATLTFARP